MVLEQFDAAGYHELLTFEKHNFYLDLILCLHLLFTGTNAPRRGYMDEKERRKSVVMNGVRLEIIVSRLSEREWTLSVLNSLGVSSTWTEFFPSADEALREGLEAISRQ